MAEKQSGAHGASSQQGGPGLQAGADGAAVTAPFVLPQSPQEHGAAVRAWLDAGKARLREAHREGRAAVDVTDALARGTEAVVTALFERATGRMAQAAGGISPPIALVALGGLGRRELAPHSDLDLVLVSDTPEATSTRKVADEVLYPLWDARLDVGHSVRSVDDFADLAAEDDTVRTAAADCRPLAGDAILLERLRARLRAALSSGRSRRYVASSVERWLAEGNPGTIYRLQPDIKSGPGGLRELHRLWWLARILWRIDAWQGLLALSLIDRQGFDVLMQGRELLLGIRLALHFIAERRQDQLRFDLQDEVAEHLGFDPSSEEERSAADNLLRAFFRHAKAVRSASLRLMERCAEAATHRRKRPSLRPVEGFQLFGDRLTLRQGDQLERDPLELLRIFRVAQRLRLPLYVHARAKIAEASPRLIDERFLAEPAVARMTLDLLSDPSDQGAALAALHELGVLERLLPELRSVMGLVQRDLYHTYTVDAHLVYCAQKILGLLDSAGVDTVPVPVPGLEPGTGPETEPVAVPEDILRIAQRVARPHVLVLGALLHDIGKGGGHGHAERGAVLARQAALRLRLGHEDVDDVEFLVREHLSMFIISQRRDLEDPDLVARFAAMVESTERLDMLVLLSYADAMTTGPEVWNDWKGSLLRDLYRRAREVLRGRALGADQASRAQARLEKVVDLLGPQAGDVRSQAERLLPRHLASHRTALLLRHFHAMDQAAEHGACCTIAPDERRGGWEIVVVGYDRPGLLADLSGVLAAHGVSVDGAYISGTRDGLAIDTFIVTPGVCPLLSADDRREALERTLEEAVHGQVEYEARLRERQRSERLFGKRAPTPATRVEYDLDARDDCTVVELFAPDSAGLLHRVAKAIFGAGASVVVARITTEGERAVDAFYLVNAETRMPLSPEERQRIDQALHDAGAGAAG